MMKTGLIFLMSVMVSAQTERLPLGLSRTIREALIRSGFQEAAHVPGAPDLDRALTSSAFATAVDVFAAGYFYADDATEGRLDGLHVSLFDRAQKRWIHAAKLPEHLGSVMNVALEDEHVIVNTHATPSAGRGLVFRRAGLRLLGVLPGFDLVMIPGPRVRFSANMVHFAPNHQERLMVFDPLSAATTEVFPGRRESELAVAYRRRVRAAYAARPADERKAFESSVYGPVDDFDRGFIRVAHSPDGRRLALIVSYNSDRLDAQNDFKRLESVVSCALARASSWSCDEQEVDAFARRARLSIRRGDSRRLSDEAVDELLRAALSRTPGRR